MKLVTNCIIVALSLFVFSCSDAPQIAQNHSQDSMSGHQHDNSKPITIVHKLGTATIAEPPVRVAALDMNEVDALAQLDIPIAGMPKDFVPHFLSQYADDNDIDDLGAIVQPNLERIYQLKPDLILMSSVQANHYQTLSNLAPTIHLDVDYKDSSNGHIETVEQHLITLGTIFNKERLAHTKAETLKSKREHAQSVIQARPEKAMVLLHNNGAFRFMGVHSRYGFIYNELGVKPASSSEHSDLHGQPISNEFIFNSNPDIIYVVDRTAVMEHRDTIDKTRLDNPLFRQTNAWKNNHIVFTNPDAWYMTGASYTSISIIIDDVLQGYIPKEKP